MVNICLRQACCKGVTEEEAAGNVSTFFTLYNVCAVPWGVLSTVGGVQYRGGYHEYCGGIS